MRAFYPRYHERPERLDGIRRGLEEALKTDPHVDNLVALAQVSFTWGDIRATSRDQKVAAYERGRQVAKRALEADPKNVRAHFWYATNTARVAQSLWEVRSLFLLLTVRDEVRMILDLDPKYAPVYALAGNTYAELPGIFGGDLGKAEAMFRKGLALDPRFTAMRLGLGKSLIRQGRVAEGRRELQAVLDEKEPRYPADWTLKDTKEAGEALQSLRGTP
jgi:cytochrome c-type biogenesis protein CcmH/NrfG